MPSPSPMKSRRMNPSPTSPSGLPGNAPSCACAVFGAPRGWRGRWWTCTPGVSWRASRVGGNAAPPAPGYRWQPSRSSRHRRLRLDPVVSLLFELLGQLLAAGLDDLAVRQDVHVIGDEVA